MTEKQKKLYKEIDKILWKDWDPIRLNDDEDWRDAYQSYTPHIFSLLIHGADKQKMIKHLSELETISMGFGVADKECIEKVVEKMWEAYTQLK